MEVSLTMTYIMMSKFDHMCEYDILKPAFRLKTGTGTTQVYRTLS